MIKRRLNVFNQSVLPLLVTIAIIFATSGAQAGKLEDIKSRGHLTCGVSNGLLGFSLMNSNKAWNGFDVDFCRAVAVAIFGKPDKVKFIPLSATERFEALENGSIDLLSRNTTWTFERDVGFNFTFIGVNYYDGQGFLIRQSEGITSALQLEGAKICVLKGTTSEINLKRYFGAKKVRVNIVEFEDRSSALKAYVDRRCDAYSADKSALAAQRLQLKDSDDHILLREVVSKEPLSPVVKNTDPSWADLVRWTLFLLINAEEAGLNSTDKNLQENFDLQFSWTDKLNSKLGLKKGWAGNVIRHIGNYGEMFERNLGKESPLLLPRSVNTLWSQGGLLYAPPMR